MTGTAMGLEGSDPTYAGIVTRLRLFARCRHRPSEHLRGRSCHRSIAEAFGEVSIEISTLEALLGALAWIAVFDVYLISFWWLAGQTPGMRILGIDVRTTEGARVTPKRGVLRLVGMVLAAIPLFAGYVPIMLNEKRQGFHDKLAKTVVRYRPPEPVRRRP